MHVFRCNRAAVFVSGGSKGAHCILQLLTKYLPFIFETVCPARRETYKGMRAGRKGFGSTEMTVTQWWEGRRKRREGRGGERKGRSVRDYGQFLLCGGDGEPQLGLCRSGRGWHRL